MCTAIWFVALGLSFGRDGRRLVGFLSAGAGLLLALAGLRNITTAVTLVAQINNITLPLWLLTLGVLFLLDGGPKGSAPLVSAPIVVPNRAV
jgi:hypothetical protein